MKICPACKEEVRDDAIRCKWCQSDLSGSEAIPYGNKVVYVLDKGNRLLRKISGRSGCCFIYTWCVRLWV
jgi:hypothetical protein